MIFKQLKFFRVNILTDRETKQMITTILRYLNLQYSMMIQGDEPTQRQNTGRCQ